MYFKDRLSGTDADTAMANSKKYMATYLIMHEDQAYGEAAKLAILKFYEQGGMREFEILSVEDEFQATLIEDEEGKILFKIDLIVRDRDNKIGVIDHKFISQFYRTDLLSLMSQLPKYLKGLQVNGYTVDWVAYNEFKHSAKQDYKFLPFPITQSRIDRTFYEHAIIAERIIALKQRVEDVPIYGLAEWADQAVRVQNTMTCGNCSFKELCIAELDNNEPQMVLDRLYKIKEYDNGPGSTEPPVGTDESSDE
jgi:hypothetical protein